jgi:hypothetical protein
MISARAEEFPMPTPSFPETGKAIQSAWPAAMASILFSLTTIGLFMVYRDVHWAILSRHIQEMSPVLKSAAGSVRSELECYRVYSLLAVVFGFWALRGKPKLIAHIALALSVVALFFACAVQ